MYSSKVYGFFNNIIVIIVFYRIYWEHVVYCTITDYKAKSEDFQCLFVDMTSTSISINATIFHKAIKEEQEDILSRVAVITTFSSRYVRHVKTKVFH